MHIDELTSQPLKVADILLAGVVHLVPAAAEVAVDPEVMVAVPFSIRSMAYDVQLAVPCIRIEMIGVAFAGLIQFSGPQSFASS